MSSLSQVRVEIIKEIQNHPNADNLSIYILSNGFNCIDKIGLFTLGERIAFVPPDMVAIDREDSRYSFLDKGRVRAKKIRGIISCGLLLKLQNPESTEDSDLSAEYGFEPWEPLTSSGVVMGGNEVKAPIQVSKYDIDSIRKYWKIFDPEIVVLEKIDGMNSGFIYNSIDNTFYLKTRTRWLKHDGESAWSKVAIKYDLEQKCKSLPDLLIYGEIYGWVQSLRYGAQPGELFFACFDIYKPEWNKFLNYDNVVEICDGQGIPRVPELYRGSWVSMEHIDGLAEQKTLAGNDRNQISEGVVVKLAHESWNQGIGRVILKYPSSTFLTRKQK
jgi:RNA ligase (TIGR02306 family)